MHWISRVYLATTFSVGLATRHCATQPNFKERSVCACVYNVLQNVLLNLAVKNTYSAVEEIFGFCVTDMQRMK